MADPRFAKGAADHGECEPKRGSGDGSPAGPDAEPLMGGGLGGKPLKLKVCCPFSYKNVAKS